jgi:hypothetical protein
MLIGGTVRERAERDQPLPAFKWLRLAFAVLMMVYSLVFGLTVAGRGLAHLPDTIRSGDLPSALGVVLVVLLNVALFSVGASLWIRCRSPHPAAVARWQRAFKVACGLSVGVMLLILTASIVARM